MAENEKQIPATSVTVDADEIARKIESGELTPPQPIPLSDLHKQSTK